MKNFFRSQALNRLLGRSSVLSSDDKNVLKKQLQVCMKSHFKLADEGKLMQLMMYFLVCYCRCKDHDRIRIKSVPGHLPKINTYSSLFASSEHKEQHEVVMLMAFGCEPTKNGLMKSLEESLTASDIPLGMRSGLAGVIKLEDLERFKGQYHHHLTALFT